MFGEKLTKIEENVETVYIGGLDPETRYGDIPIIFNNVPIVQVVKLWHNELNLISAIILVHKDDIPKILKYERKQVFLNLPPLMVMPINQYKAEKTKQMKSKQGGHEP